MTTAHSGQFSDCQGLAYLFWDLAGTLIHSLSPSRASAALPGCDEFLPQLAQDFQLVVTTGEGTGSAKDLLRRVDLLGHFVEVCGGLGGLIAGKPYGEILDRRGGRPECSLAVGDRLAADVPADTDQVVTVLINQGSQVANAGMVAYLIELLRKQSDSFPEAFIRLADAAQPIQAPFASVKEAWQREDGLAYQLWIYRNHVLEGDRLVIVI